MDAHKANQFARLAQGHIGIARLYATQPEAVRMRNNIVDNLVSMTRTSQAVLLAQELCASAQDQAQSSIDAQVEAQQKEFRRSHGLADDDLIDASVRSQYNAIGKKMMLNVE